MNGKTTRLAILAISAFALSSSLMANTVVSPEISDVHVYPQGADIIRQFTVDVPVGNHRVVVQGLPTTADDFDVRALGSSSHVRIIDTKYNVVFDDEAYADRVRELDEQIDVLNQEIAKYEDDLSSVAMEIKLLQGIVEQHPHRDVPESNSVALDIDHTRSILALIRESSTEAFDLRREVRRAIDDAKSMRRQLERERNQLGGQESGSAELSIGIMATEAKETEFVVSYFSRRAGWQSKYHAYLDSSSQTFAIVHDAIVFQQSPEPWIDVSLTLSTASPDRRTAPPRQYSHFVDLREPRIEMAMNGREEMVVTGSRLPGTPDTGDIIFDQRYSVATMYPFSTQYKTALPQSVANDGSQHGIIGLGSYTFDDIDTKTTIVPRHDDVGYLAAYFSYDRDLPLPRGSLKCFVDGSFVGETHLEHVHSNSEVVIPLGINRGISVAVENQGGMKGDEGIFRNRSVEETHFLVTIENNGSTRSSLEVLDYYPVARHEDIKIDVHRDATSPSKSDIDDRPGRIAWTKQLDSGETWQILQRYSISYPRDSMLSKTSR